MDDFLDDYRRIFTRYCGKCADHAGGVCLRRNEYVKRWDSCPEWGE